jgi:hypothetical protein
VSSKEHKLLNNYRELARHYCFDSYKLIECLGLKIKKQLSISNKCIGYEVFVVMYDGLEFDIEDYPNYLSALNAVMLICENTGLTIANPD